MQTLLGTSEPKCKNTGFTQLDATCGACTGKSLSEAFILTSVNPQYDKTLFIEFPKKYKFRTCCVQKLFFVLTFKTIIVHNMF